MMFRFPFSRVISAFVYVLLPMACSTGGSEAQITESNSAYEAMLPATDFGAASLGSEPREDSEPSIQKMLSEVNKDTRQADQMRQRETLTQTLQVRPALLLDQTYTIQMGIFDESLIASSFISTNQLSAKEAGIANVTLEGEQKFLLAYGVYSTAAEAEKVAEQLSKRIQSQLKVVSLAEIKTISKIVKPDSEALGIDIF